MTTQLPSRPAATPSWVKMAFALFVGALVPTYWRDYGPANFLWFCDMGLLITLAGLWLDSPLLISTEAVALAGPQTFWIADFLSGGRIIGVSAYMFNPAIPLFTRILSTFHLWLPILLIYLVWRMGYDRRAFWLQSLIAAGVLLASYLLTDPRHRPDAYPSAAVNVNRVWGIHQTDVQTWMPSILFLGLHVLFWPLFFYLPTHLIFRKVFRQRDGRGGRAFNRISADPKTLNEDDARTIGVADT